MNLNIQYNYLKLNYLLIPKTSYLGVELTFACNLKVAATSVMCIFFFNLVKGNKTITWTFCLLIKLTEKYVCIKSHISLYNSPLEFSL